VKGLGSQLFPGWESSTADSNHHVVTGPDVLDVNPSGEPTEKKHNIFVLIMFP